MLQRMWATAIWGLEHGDAVRLETILICGGWGAKEGVAIAIYCSLKYENAFSKGIISAVNHSRDSDSTGAITERFLGAWPDYKNIKDNGKHNLELSDVILELADDLCDGC